MIIFVTHATFVIVVTLIQVTSKFMMRISIATFSAMLGPSGVVA
jgi:hypothetical protein